MTVTAGIPVWLDCDTGNDDAFAIILLACLPQFNLVGVSTSYGNAPLENTTRNTLAILETLKFLPDEVKVYPGARAPLHGNPTYALDIHGKNGIGGIDPYRKLSLQPALDETFFEAVLAEAAKWNGELRLVCTGPMTNLAQLVKSHPDVREQLKLISVMGCAFDGVYNITPYSEFNIHADAEAASIIFGDAILRPKLIILPLNITHKAIVTPEIQSRILGEELNTTDMRRAFYNISEEFRKVYKEARSFSTGPPVHDPVAVAVLLALEDVFGNHDFYNLEYKRGIVEVETSGEKEGMTTLHRVADDEPGSFIAYDIDITKFWNLVFEAFAFADYK